MKYRTKPMSQQREALRRLAGRNAYALFMEQGTGKSWVVINWAADLYLKGKLDAVIVLAPNGVQDQWVIDQIPEHMPEEVPYNAFAWGAGMGVRLTKQFEAFRKDCSGALKILTINMESLGQKRGLDVITNFLVNQGKVMLVVDESDMVKNPGAGRTKALLKLRRLAAYRIILSGTPAAQSPFDLWAPFNFLDPTILGSSYFAFKAKYAEMISPTDGLAFAIRARTGSSRLPQVVAKDDQGQPKYRHLDQLQKAIAPHSYRVLKRDCIDLPDKVYARRYVDLAPKQRAIYNEAVRTLRIEWEAADGSPQTSIATKLTILGRLQQIAGGFLPDQQSLFEEDPTDNPKVAALLETIKRQQKAIVWARYIPEIEMLVQVLSNLGETVAFYGDVSRDNRKKAVAAFQSGEARFFVGNQQAGGVGLNLTAATFTHYYSNAFPLRTRLQSEDRNHRKGTTQKITYYDYEAKGTVDRKIITTLQNRLSIADAVMGDQRSGEWLNEI